MLDESGPSLEEALARTEAEAEAALKAAGAVAKALKRFRGTAQAGNLRELRPAIVAAEQALAGLEQQLDRAKGSWDFDEEGYFADSAFSRELVETGRQMQVRLFEEDDRLYCYPILVRVQANDRSVLIDKARERRLRPSVLVAQLKELQGRPPRFRPEAFLDSLFKAYAALVGKQRLSEGRVEKLLDVYDLLTLLPGSGRDYSRQEFARDLYLLDQSGVTTRRGFALGFHASSGSRAAGSTIRVITENGQDRLYYGLSFAPSE